MSAKAAVEAVPVVEIGGGSIRVRTSRLDVSAELPTLPLPQSTFAGHNACGAAINAFMREVCREDSAAANRGKQVSAARARRRGPKLVPPVHSYRKAHLDSALRKLERAAKSTFVGADAADLGGDFGRLAGFRAGTLEPRAFDAQLRTALNMHLSPSELGALSDRYPSSIPPAGSVSMPEFLRELYAMARKSIRADGERRRRDAEDTTRRKEARAERLVAKALAMKRMAGGEVAMIRDHETGESTPAVSSAQMRGDVGAGDSTDGGGATDSRASVAQLPPAMRSLLAKVRAAAQRRDIERGGLHTRCGGNLAELGLAKALAPSEFRGLLRRNIDVALTPAEARQAALRWPLRCQAPSIDAEVTKEGTGARTDNLDAGRGAQTASDQCRPADDTKYVGCDGSIGNEDGGGDATQNGVEGGSVPEAVVRADEWTPGFVCCRSFMAEWATMRRRAWAERVVDANARELRASEAALRRALLTQANAMDKLQGPMPLGEGVPSRRVPPEAAGGAPPLHGHEHRVVPFSSKQRTSVMRSVGAATASLQSTCVSGAPTPMSSFEGASMDQPTFRRLLREVLSLRFSRAQLAALLAMLQPSGTDNRGGGGATGSSDDDGGEMDVTPQPVDLRAFARLLVRLRREGAAATMAARRRAEGARMKRAARRKAVAAEATRRRLALRPDNAPPPSERTVERARSRLRIAACRLDHVRTGALQALSSCEAMAQASASVPQFRSVLRAIFTHAGLGVKVKAGWGLSPVEVQALVQHYRYTSAMAREEKTKSSGDVRDEMSVDLGSPAGSVPVASPVSSSTARDSDVVLTPSTAGSPAAADSPGSTGSNHTLASAADSPEASSASQEEETAASNEPKTAESDGKSSDVKNSDVNDIPAESKRSLLAQISAFLKSLLRCIPQKRGGSRANRTMDDDISSTVGGPGVTTTDVAGGMTAMPNENDVVNGADTLGTEQRGEHGDNDDHDRDEARDQAAAVANMVADALAEAEASVEAETEVEPHLVEDDTVPSLLSPAANNAKISAGDDHEVGSHEVPKGLQESREDRISTKMFLTDFMRMCADGAQQARAHARRGREILAQRSEAHRQVVEARRLRIVADDIGVELERVGADGRPIEEDNTGADGALGILTRETVDVRDLEEARRRLAAGAAKRAHARDRAPQQYAELRALLEAKHMTCAEFRTVLRHPAVGAEPALRRKHVAAMVRAHRIKPLAQLGVMQPVGAAPSLRLPMVDAHAFHMELVALDRVARKAAAAAAARGRKVAGVQKE